MKKNVFYLYNEFDESILNLKDKLEKDGIHFELHRYNNDIDKDYSHELISNLAFSNINLLVIDDVSDIDILLIKTLIPKMEIIKANKKNLYNDIKKHKVNKTRLLKIEELFKKKNINNFKKYLLEVIKNNKNIELNDCIFNFFFKDKYEKLILQVIKENIKELDDIKNKSVYIECTKNKYYIDEKGNSVMEGSLEGLAKKYNQIREDLNEIVIGQENAIEKICKGLYNSELNKPTEDDHRPLCTFFFFGAPGTGKTFLVNNLAKMLGIKYRLFNMGQYAYEGDQITFIGSDKGWKNSKQGELPKFILENKDNPHIIIFDEIEKAHPDVLQIFLSMLGSGELSDDSKGLTVDLHNTIMIFTSNVGKSIYEDQSRDFSNVPIPTLIDSFRSEKNIEGKPVFSPEFCSRIMASNIITFKNLSINTLNRIVINNMIELKKTIKDNYDINVKIDEKLPLLFVYNIGKTDARIISKAAKQFIMDEMFNLSKQNNKVKLNKIKDIEFTIDLKNIDPELKTLFVSKKKHKIAIIADNKVANLFNNIANIEIIKIHDYDDLIDSLRQDIFAYFIDPFFGGVKQKALSITDYNADGINMFYTVSESDTEVPIYILNSKQNNISSADKLSLINDGARRIIDINDEFNKTINRIINDIYMENQSASLTQKGWVIDYSSKQRLVSKDKVNVEIGDFRKYYAYDVESQNLMSKLSDIPETRFKDVIGCNQAKRELSYYINYLKNPMDFILSGERLPKGVLLYGLPGTGKTMLARAMAGEANVNFMAINASELISPVVGESEANINRIFNKARKYAPTIIFIDEIDAIGKTRKGGNTDSMLNTLLTEIDGFKQSRKPVFVLAATNYGTSYNQSETGELDPALVRRFDNSIYIELPNKKERIEYINYFLTRKGINNISKGTINTLADCTVGKSPAIIENILELAFRNSLIEQKPLNNDILLNALDEYENGDIKQHNYSMMKSTAIHEASHALISYLVKQVPSYVTIVSRRGYGGYVISEDKEKSTYTKNDLLNRIRILLAGRVGQEVILGKQASLNTGASSDLEMASKIALNIITSFGMNDSLLIASENSPLYASMASEYTKQAEELLNKEYKETKKILTANKKQLKELADLLLEKSHLTKEELLDFFRGK